MKMNSRKDLPDTHGDLYILDRSVYDCLDVFMALLLNAAEFTLIPDLAGIFGAESVVKFIDIFAGTKIEVPGKDILQTLVRDANIYVSMKNNPDERKNLARMYEISEDSVSRVYEKIKTLIEEQENG
jgi:Mor family transcriptional regulator